jgi:hypothetical protein
MDGASVATAGASVATGTSTTGGSVTTGAAVGAGAQLAINTLIKSTIAIKLLSLVFITHLLSILQKWDDSFFPLRCHVNSSSPFFEFDPIWGY